MRLSGSNDQGVGRKGWRKRSSLTKPSVAVFATDLARKDHYGIDYDTTDRVSYRHGAGGGKSTLIGSSNILYAGGNVKTMKYHEFHMNWNSEVLVQGFHSGDANAWILP